MGGKIISPGEIGRRLAAMREKVEGNCKVCGQPFLGTTKRRFCSSRCRQQAHRRPVAAVENYVDNESSHERTPK